MIKYENKNDIVRFCSSYLHDESRMKGETEALYFPESFDELVSLVRELAKEEEKFTISSGRTGITGGAVPQGGVLISLEKMDNILGIEQNEETSRMHLRVQAGVTLNSINDFISKYKFINGKEYLFPVDPTEPAACAGGMAAVNASGARSFRNGSLRNHVFAATVILPDGEVLGMTRGMFLAEDDKICFSSIRGKDYELRIEKTSFSDIKNNAGYFYKPGMDLLDLFIGSEGTLGIITEIEVMLVEKRQLEFPFMAFFKDEGSAIDCVQTLRDRQEVLAIEYFGPESIELLKKKQEENPRISLPALKNFYNAALLVDIGLVEGDLENAILALKPVLERHSSSLDDTWDGSINKDSERLKLFRHLVPETINALIGKVNQKHPEIVKLGTDIAVPDNTFREMLSFYRQKLDEAKLQYVLFGHIGDSHVHVNIIPKDPEEYGRGKEIVRQFVIKAVSLGGTVSGEHGIGKIKKPYLELMYSEKDLESMRRVKRFFDPAGLLNSGNVL